MKSFEGPYDAYVGFDVGKLAHRACCVLTGGSVAFNVGVANDEAAIDRVLAEAAAHGRALAVVDQRRNIGTTVVRRARAAGVEVAYLPGIAASRASSLFPGDAKTDERDAEVIARTAMGVPQALRPVPEEGALEGARRLEAQRCDLLRDRTHCVNRLRALLLESNPAFERELDCEAAWALSLMSRVGGPWQVLDAGRRRYAALTRDAPRGAADRLWAALKAASRPTEAQVRAEATLVRMLASRIAEDTALIAELAALVEAEVGGRRDVPVPAHGARRRPQDRRAARPLRGHLRLRGPRPPGQLLRPGAQEPPVGDLAQLGVVL